MEQTPLQRAQQLAAAGQHQQAIACLRPYLAASPADGDAQALLVRAHAWHKDYPAARQALAASPLVGTAAGDELAGDIAWYEGDPLASARHYRAGAKKLLASSASHGNMSLTDQAARLWHKTIRGYRAGGDGAAEGAAVLQAKSLLTKVPDGRAKAALTASIAAYKSSVVARPAKPAEQPMPAEQLGPASSNEPPQAKTYELAAETEFLFLDRFVKDGYSHTIAGRGGLKGRDATITGTVARSARWNLGLVAQRRERFFGAGNEPTDAVGGLIAGFGFTPGGSILGQKRHSVSADLRWSRKPAFTYHNQFTLGYSLPLLAGSLDLSLRHTRYALAQSQRLGAGLSYYAGSWLWLPRFYATHVSPAGQSSGQEHHPRWSGAADLKGIAYLGSYTIQGWLGGGKGEPSQPESSAQGEQVGYIAYGASVAKAFRGEALKAGISAARHSEPRYHQNTIGLNISWRRF